MTTMTSWNKIVANMDNVAASRRRQAEKEEKERKDKEEKERKDKEQKEEKDKIDRLNKTRRQEYDEIKKIIEPLNDKRAKITKSGVANLPLYKLEETYYKTSKDILESLWHIEKEVERLVEETEPYYADVLVPGPRFKEVKMEWRHGINSGTMELPRLKEVVKNGNGFNHFYQACQNLFASQVRPLDLYGVNYWFYHDGKQVSFGEAFDIAYEVRTMFYKQI